MAGAFTHFVISDVTKSKRPILGKELWQLLNRHYQFLFLGAVSPDLPYLSFEFGKVNWADVMHYEKTNGIVVSGFEKLQSLCSNKTLSDEAKYIWLMGYVSHLIADATIHPVVQAIVGRYEDNPDEHCLCEMTQDSIIFNIRRKTEIRYSEFSSMLKFCRESEYFDELMGFWKELITINYQDKNEEPHPARWFKTYSEAIDTAEGGSKFVALFRHIGLGEEYIYRTSEEIKRDYPQDYKKYCKEVKLPHGKVGTFQKDGFERTVNNVANAWKMFYDGLQSEIVVGQTIKNWNLDTGFDMDSPDKKVTYWS
jgi:hypothetical protein